MLLHAIEKNPTESLLYMERFVNNGSGSPFTFVNTVSKETNPLYAKEFYLDLGENLDAELLSYGAFPEALRSLKPVDSIFIHPDWEKEDTFFSTRKSEIIVEPTASQRTVKVKGMPYYIKLAHPYILGRITRELETKHIYSSIDVTNILFATYINAPYKFAFFPESCGQVLRFGTSEIGYVIRSAKPVGKNAQKIKYLVPGFSLFGKDRKQKNDPLLIHQILAKKTNKRRFILDEIILPLIDCYFFYIFAEGLQFELHAQNFLIGFDGDFEVVSFVIRDLESADKDITIRKLLNKDNKLLSSPYKCISADQWNYKIKHSFMYDHKLCEYFIDPLLSAVADDIGSTIDCLRTEVKSEVINRYGEKLINFFPDDGCWYKFENKIIDRTLSSRPYQATPNPFFR